MQQRGLEFGAPGPGPEETPRSTRARALSVSALTERIQGFLETEFVDVWVEGEVSNLRIMPSGHWYFTLKDDRAQIKAVVWKSDARYLRFRPKDGAKVLVRGAVRLYPPRGEYQVAVQVLEPLGKGSLQQAFEDLKERLEKEGLFAPERKRPLPMLPRRIGVVTSPTGAVIRDILRVLKARYPNLDVLVYPCRVQGPEAAGEIAAGIRALNRIPSVDVLILARGGGSLEDLWPFNDEQVARALSASRIPTLSAVGHETDFTIADFVADLRAPSPSAGAERVVQAKSDLQARIESLARQLHAAERLRLARVRSRVEAVTAHRVFAAERGRLHTKAQRVDELSRRSQVALSHRLETARARLGSARARLLAFPVAQALARRRDRIHQLEASLARGLVRRVEGGRGALAALAGKLDALSPVAVLARGYALVWDASGRRILRRADEAAVGDTIRVRLGQGALTASVSGTEPS